MRHKKSFNHLGRTSSHRKAMLSNMACSLIAHKRIETTTAKAKALKRYIEPLITRSKDDSTHSRRVVFSQLQDKEAVSELFREVAAKVGDRPGGYTRIIKLGNRQGDNADMCLIELVDYNELLLAEKAAAKKTTSRRRRGAGKTKAEAAPKAKAGVEAAGQPAIEAVTAEAAVAEEAVVEEAVAEEAAVEEVVAEEAAVEEVVAVEAVTEEPVVEETPKAEAAPEEPEVEEPKAEEGTEEEEKKDS